MTDITIKQGHVDAFMSNVSKAFKKAPIKHSVLFGTVKLIRSASESKTGKREFSLSNVKHPALRPGKYSYASLRRELSKLVK